MLTAKPVGGDRGSTVELIPIVSSATEIRRTADSGGEASLIDGTWPLSRCVAAWSMRSSVLRTIACDKALLPGRPGCASPEQLAMHGLESYAQGAVNAPNTVPYATQGQRSFTAHQASFSSRGLPCSVTTRCGSAASIGWPRAATCSAC